MVPNIKDIPENCEDLFNDDVVYEVPGDGACGHIFLRTKSLDQNLEKI